MLLMKTTYDDLVDVVTSHMTKMAVTLLDPPWPKHPPPVVRKLDDSVFYTSLKHIFGPVTDCSILYATGVTRIQNVVLRRIGGRGHFRSRDKDGGHTI